MLKPNKKWIKGDKDKILREKLIPLDLPINDDDKHYMEMMQAYIDTCYNDESDKCKIKSGIAIAANQIGWNKRVIYVHFNFDNKEVKYFLANPKIISYSKQIVCLGNGEGCLSVNKKHPGFVPRYNKITIKAYDLINDKEITFTEEKMVSICLQHEMDHLDGILYYDRIVDKNDPWKKNENWEIIF